MKNYYDNCTFCPRNCGVNRSNGETGYCGETAALRIGSAGVHHGEEPSFIGTGGSGTIFISGCNLGCIFCQCYQVSQGESVCGSQSLGKIVSIEEFAKICIELQNKGAENINIVTGSHVVPILVEGFISAKKAGLRIPFLWNSSSYDSLEALELIKDHVDLYMPDLKTLDTKLAAKFFNAPDYPEVAKAAILKMIDISNDVVIRHLILPGYLESTRSVLQWFADNAKGRAALSLMTQYTPIPGKEKNAPDRYVNKEEYETVIKWLEEFQIEDGFFQELLTSEEWLPDFRRANPFPSDILTPVWSLQ
ncbi:MAG: radical SAM protein [Treponema sp.]|nr:radical SAM protein [Treponema sp.]